MGVIIRSQGGNTDLSAYWTSGQTISYVDSILSELTGEY